MTESVSPSPEILEAVLSFANAGSLDELKHLVSERRKELLSDAADAVLERLILQHRDREEDLTHLRSRRTLLALCRERGIEAAFKQDTTASSLSELVMTFVNIREMDKLLAFVEEHEIKLLSPEAEAILRHLEIQYRDDPNILALLKERLELLAKCHDLGTGQAFADDVQKIPEPLGIAIARFMQAGSNIELRSILLEHGDQLLTDAAEQLLGFLAKGTDPTQSELFRLRLQLLRRCRLDGIDVALDLPPIASMVTSSIVDTASSRLEPEELRRRLVEELQAMAGSDGAIPEAAVRELVERRPELSGALLEALQRGDIHWTPPSDRTPLQSMIEEMTGAELSGEWERVIALGAQALQRAVVDPDPRLAAMVHFGLGTALSKTPHGDRASNVDRAIAHHEEARRVLQAREDDRERDLWAMNEHHLALALSQRVRGDRTQNIEAAIDVWRDLIAKSSRDDRPTEWMIGLANVLRQRVIGDPQKNAEEAAEILRSAITAAEAQCDELNLARARVTLGISLIELPGGDPAANIENAIDQISRGLNSIDPRAELVSWANVQRSLARAYTQRMLGNRVDNLRTARKIIESVSAACPKEQFPEMWAEAQLALAGLAQEGRSIEGTLEAARVMATALDVYTRKDFPDRWAKVNLNIGSLFSVVFASTDKAEHFDSAWSHIEQALTVLTRQRSPTRWALAHHILGKLHMHRAEITDENSREQAANIAIDHFERALEARTLTADPAGRIETLKYVASIHFHHRAWNNALSVYVDAMRASDQLLGAAFTEEARLAEAGPASWVYSSAAYCLEKLNDPTAALICLDWGKGRLLAEALAVRDLDLVHLPATEIERIRSSRHEVRRLEFAMRSADDASAERLAGLSEALRQARSNLAGAVAAATSASGLLNHTRLTPHQLFDAIPAPGAIVVPLFTPVGAIVYLLIRAKAHDAQIIRVLLDDRTGPSLRYIIRGTQQAPGWWARYKSWRSGEATLSSWRDTITSTMDMLWELVLRPVAEALDRHLPPDAPAIVVPQGELSFLPFHAAGSANPGASCLLDRFTVTYAPSLYTLHTCQRRLAGRDRSTIRAVAAVNPTRDLPFAAAEADALEASIPKTDLRILTGGDAGKGSIEAVAGEATHLHFACHGHYNHLDVMQSGLLLSDGILTLSAILGTELNLSAARLVTLSACDTGLNEMRQSPDEFIGLPTAFLEGGACGVVSTLWPVADRATSLLMRRFYHGHMVEGLPPAQALRRAQLWLREATRSELAEHYLSKKGPDTLERHEAFLELTLGGSDERPYQHPYYWAAFQFVGA
jgi:CHAT domain-containing protein